MKKSKFWIVLIASLALVASIAILVGDMPASEKSTEVTFKSLGEVSDFGLTDQQGIFHQFSYYNDKQAMVVFVQGNGCPIVRNSISELHELRRKFSSDGIQFFMINPNVQDNVKEVKEEAEEFNIQLPILLDKHQLVANMLDLRVTAETLLIDIKTGQIIYRGPISDRVGFETQKKTAEHRYLQDAIQNFLAGKFIDEPERKTRGCAITRLSDSRSDNITYTKDVTPILKQKCVSCHQQGGIAPWAMSDYQTVVGWSSMIKNVVHTKRMPPWHADPNIGNFSNDLSLSDAEIETLMSWIDGGMVRGDGEDHLAQRPPDTQAWRLGKPDFVMELEPESIPATGIIDYRYQSFKFHADKTVYVKAVEIHPERTEILHHVLATVEYPEDYELPLDRKRGPWIDGILASWAPGMQPETFPEGTGRIIPEGSTVHIQLHYTTNGRAQVDQSKIGLHFLNEPPEREYITIGPTDFDLEILPNDAEHISTITEKIYEDIRVFGFFPHMHFRGKSMKYTLEDPEGNRTQLLSVPNYSFNWQRYYELETPIDVKKGSRIIVDAVFDNSRQNPFNPSPQDTLYFGEQTSDEMMIGFFSYHKL
jgi:peroxiredoxin